MQLTVPDFYIIRIPDCRTAKLRHRNSVNLNPLVMPEWITEIEKNIFHLNVACLLERALAVCRTVKRTIFYINVSAAI